MVDALRRAHRMATPDGCVVDLHPSAAPALLEVGARTTGRVEAADAPLRHAAAGIALAAVVDEGLFAIERAIEFTFYTYGDTIDELREYIVENWRNAQIDDETVERTRAALGAGLQSEVRPRVREHVLATRLRPLAP